MPNYTVLEIKRSDNLTRERNGFRCLWILESKDMVDDTLASYVWAHWPEQLGPQPPRHTICEKDIDDYFKEMDGIEYIFIHPPEPLLTTLGTKFANAGLKTFYVIWLATSCLAAISRMLVDGVNWMDMSVAATPPIVLALGALVWDFRRNEGDKHD